MSELPRGWCSTCFEQISDIQLGKMLDKAKNTGNPTPYLRNINVRWGEVDISDVLSMPMSDDERSKFSICDGDVLVCEGGEPGRAAVWRLGPTDIKFQKAILRVRAAGSINSDWLARYLWLAARDGKLEQRFTGTTIKHLPREALQKTTLPLPPLPEQRRIVAKIDSLSAKSACARDNLDHIPRLVEKYKQAILAAAFRGDLTREWRTNNGVSIDIDATRRKRAASTVDKRRREALATLPERGGFEHLLPSTWRWVTIEELASDEPRSIQSGPFGSALLHSEFVPHGRLVIGIDNVQDGYFSLGSQNRITEFKFSELIRFAARPHDVLVTVMATIGRVCVLPASLEPAIITKHVYRITVDDRCALPEFVAFGLRGSEAALSHMGANVRGQTRPGLNGEIIKSLFLPVPPLQEQTEVVRRIESAFTWIDRLSKEATSARKLVDHIDQTVLAKAFRGELVPQDANDEPASVLLERIRAERGPGAKSGRGRRSAMARA